MDSQVVVIGAGAAGLQAAYDLEQLGLACVVLEAKDRIGGRVWTRYDVAEHPVECGAELIHGQKVSTWAWVERLGLSAIHWPKQDDSLVRMNDGQLLTMR